MEKYNNLFFKMKITYLTIVKFLFPTISTYILILGVFYLMFSNVLPTFRDLNIVLFFSFILILPVCIELIILFNYYKINKNIHMSKNKSGIQINFNNKRKFEITEKNIISWQLTGTASKLQNSSIKFSMLDDLFYIKVVLDNKDTITLTSLLYKDIDKLFEDLFIDYKIDDRKSNFPLVK